MTDKAKKTSEKKSTDNNQMVLKAVLEGRKLIDAGEPKIIAAMYMFKILENEERDTVVKAFVEGASLTSKGALTYWYNCRRKMLKIKNDLKSDKNP